MKNTEKLTVMQVNVGRGGPASNLALALGHERGIDIIMIQEPWIGQDLDRKMCKKHKGYQAYVPEDEWEERPRVITYIQQGELIPCTEKRQDILKTNGNQDVPLLEIQLGAASEPPIYVLNMYNAPSNCHHAGKAVELLMRSQSLMLHKVLVGGDLNLHHMDWDARTLRATRQAVELSEWVTKNAAFYELATGTITYNQRGSIDQVIASASLTNSMVAGKGINSDVRNLRSSTPFWSGSRSWGRYGLVWLAQKSFHHP